MQALCKSCRLLFVLRWNLFFVSSSPHFIRAFGGVGGIPFDWWDYFTLYFLFFFFFSFLTSSVLHPVIMTRGRRMDASSRWLLTQKTSFFVGICITKLFLLVLCVSKSQSAVAAHLSPFKTDLCRRMHLFSVPFLFLPSFPF